MEREKMIEEIAKKVCIACCCTLAMWRNYERLDGKL